MCSSARGESIERRGQLPLPAPPPPPPFAVLRALKSQYPITDDLLPAFDLLVFDLELCLIPAAAELDEPEEEVNEAPFPAAANTPGLAYEPYRGEERSAEGAAAK